MGRLIDLTGQRFGRLVVLERAGSDKNKSALWFCRCDCGKEKVINSKSLRNGSTRSCGCLHQELPAIRLNLAGQRFGRLVAIERVGSNKDNLSL